MCGPSISTNRAFGRCSHSAETDAGECMTSRLACGTVGLLAGFVVPELGLAAAIGLVVYFVCAVTAHLRVGDRELGGAVFFLVLVAAALVTTVVYHDFW